METYLGRDDIKEVDALPIILIAMITVLILFGTHSVIFSFVAFGISAYMLVMMDREISLMMLIYLMSFAHIFKISPEGMSFFTFLIIIYVIMEMMKTGKLPVWGFIFCFYMIIVQSCIGTISIKSDIKVIGNIFFIFYAFEESEYYSDKKIYLSYVVGVIIAAALRYFDSGFFRISSYAGATVLEKFGVKAAIQSIERFSGIYSDPNYFGVNLILSLCLLLTLYAKKKLNLKYVIILAAPILYYAVMTRSKSVLGMMLLPICMFLYANHKKRKYMTQLVFFIGGIGLILAIISGQVHFLDGIMQRLDSSSTANISELTTGRADVWLEFIRMFYENPTEFIWGVGIGNFGTDKTVHSFYLESLRYAGVIGSGMLFLSIKSTYDQYRIYVTLNIMNFSVLICVLTMYSCLNQLHDYEFPIHFLLMLMVLNTSFENFNEGNNA